jgi:hypothetical protein
MIAGQNATAGIIIAGMISLTPQLARAGSQITNTHAFFAGHADRTGVIVREGSAIMTTDLTHVAIADNESFDLQVYQNMPAVPGINPTAFAALNLATTAPGTGIVWQLDGGNRREPDIEACTALTVGGVRNIIWVASHSRHTGGNYRYNRHFFFRTTVNGAGNLLNAGIWPNQVDVAGDGMSDAGGAAEITLTGLLRVPALTAAWNAALPNGAAGWPGGAFNNCFAPVGVPGVGPNSKAPVPAPFANLSIPSGFNVEGLAVSPVNSLAYVGLRGPMYWTGAAPGGAGNANVAANRALAVLVPITNFTASKIVAGPAPAGVDPVIGLPVLLDLDGRAIRSIEYIRGQYVITAGGGLSSDGAGLAANDPLRVDLDDPDNMALFTWSGNPNDRPVQQLNSMMDPETGAGATAEGLCEAPDIFGESLIQFVIDGAANGSGTGIDHAQQTFLGRLQGEVRGVEAHQWPHLEITSRHAVAGVDHCDYGVTAGGVAAVNYRVSALVPFVASVLPSVGGGAATNIALEQQNVTAAGAFGAFSLTAVPAVGNLTHTTAERYGQTIAVNLTAAAATMGAAGAPLLSGLLYRASIQNPGPPVNVLSRSENGVGVFRISYLAGNINPVGAYPFKSHISNDINAQMALYPYSDTYSTYDVTREALWYNGFQWEDPITAVPGTSILSPGKAFLFNLGTTAVPAFTFLGEIPAGTDLTTVRTTVPGVTANFTGCVSKSFLGGRIRTLGIRPLAGDRVIRYANLDGTGGAGTTFDGENWAPLAEPVVGVCEPFFILRPGAVSAVARTWQESYRVWP